MRLAGLARGWSARSKPSILFPMPAASKLNLSLPPALVRAIEAQVEAGTHASPSDVVAEALRLWHRQEEDHANRIAAMKSRIRRSLEDPSPDLDYDSVMRRLTSSVRRRSESYRISKT